MQVKLSISIVVYRKYDDVIEAVDSIEKQTSSQLKKTIYIVDNSQVGEHHYERMTFEKHLRQYTDVVYINTGENLGFGKGHNYVMERLQSEYHAIVNPDIVLNEDAFSALISYMEKTDAGMTIPRLLNEQGDLLDAYRRNPTVFDMYLRMFTKKVCQKRRDCHSMKDQDYTQPFQVPFGQGSFLVIRTELWKRLKGFDDRYFMYLEDADLCRRVNQISKLMYCPDATVVHRWEKASHKNMKLFSIHMKSMFTYFNKWGWKLC